MKNTKKKLVVICLALAMLLVAVIGTTVAYFTDTEGATNTMTSGNVYITQNEKNREGTNLDPNGDGLVELGDLIPAVYAASAFDNGAVDREALIDATVDIGNDQTIANIWASKINNELDKFVTVTNTGSRDAYVRTIFLFENALYSENHNTTGDTSDDENNITLLSKLNILWNNDAQNVTVEWIDSQAIYDLGANTSYSIAVVTYKNPVVAGATSADSLRQIHLDYSADNDWSEATKTQAQKDAGQDGTYTIIAFSQAVQTTGFDATLGYDGAAPALNAAFDAVNEANVANWLVDLGITA